MAPFRSTIRMASDAASKIASARASLRRTAAFERVPSVMSRATLEAPMIRPPASLIGALVSTISILLPPLATRTVSRWSMISPRRILSRIPASSARRSSGMMRMIDWPIISAAPYPKIRAAAGFQAVTIPSSVSPIIASSDDLTMAASQASLSSSGLLSAVILASSDHWTNVEDSEPGSSSARMLHRQIRVNNHRDPARGLAPCAVAWTGVCAPHSVVRLPRSERRPCRQVHEFLRRCSWHFGCSLFCSWNPPRA